jgi:ferrous iron transport protein A
MYTTEETTLANLPLGRRGIVKSLDAEGIIRRRLLDLGLIPGTVVEPIRKSPAGDPIAFKIRGAVIALRLEEGHRVCVRPL